MEKVDVQPPREILFVEERILIFEEELEEEDDLEISLLILKNS